MTNSMRDMETRLIKAYIIDDDRSSIEILEKMLVKNFSVTVCGSSQSIEGAIADFATKEPDIVFLDMEMDGTTTLKRYTEIQDTLPQETKIVFYTGYDKYMIDAIRNQAFDYIVKPVEETALSMIMNRFYEQKLSDFKKKLEASKNNQRAILVQNEYNEQRALSPSEISFFRFNTETRIWEIICSDDSVHSLRSRTSAEIILAYSPYFVQIHKKYIVNINRIDRIIENKCILIGNKTEESELRVSKNYKRNLINSFYNM